MFARAPWMVAAVAVVALAAAPEVAGAATATDEMARCAALGPKRPGNAAGRTMAARLAQRFRAAGLRTSVEDFHLPLYVLRRASLRIVGSGARAVDGEAFTFGANGRVVAPVVDVGVGREGDYAGKDVRGRIVMVQRDVAFHRSSQLNEVVEHGGAAMLYVSESPGNLVQTGTVRFAQRPPGSIPAVTVGAQDGAVLRRELAAGGLRMRVEVDARRDDTVARNVIGVRRGTRYPNRVIVLGAHYDSWYGGAVDNCSGVGSLLGVLDAVEDLDPAYTLVFAGWDAEETGLTGSYDWVMRHPRLARRAVVNQNFEMTAAGADTLSVRFGTNAAALTGVASAASARNAFAPAVLPLSTIRSISGGIIPTDLQAFYATGAQGFSTFSQTPYYHTTQDTLDKVDPPSLERVTRFMRDVLVDLQPVRLSRLRVREVPEVEVSVPSSARPGQKLTAEIRVTDPGGRPVSGVPVRVLVNQRDHWPVAEGFARALGEGRYRYRVPAGVTEADVSWLTATVERPDYIAEGFARVDQRRGGLLAPAPYACAPRGRVALDVRRPASAGPLTRLRATASRGRARVVGHRIVVDGLGASRDELRVRVAARSSTGGTLRQARTYRRCATAASIARALGGD